jgi:prepilin signal peptidase PulO-like enzyme (type II secretory pathway)
MRPYQKISLVIVLVVLAACTARQPAPPVMQTVPGFWLGLWHGIIAPFALLVGLFSHVRVYAYPNSGWWYDFGFLIGVVGFSGV